MKYTERETMNSLEGIIRDNEKGELEHLRAIIAVITCERNDLESRLEGFRDELTLQQNWYNAEIAFWKFKAGNK